MMVQEELVAVGSIGRPVGLRGEVTVQPFRIDHDQWLGFSRVWVGGEEREAEELEIETCRIMQQRVVVKFRGKNFRKDVEKLKHKTVFADAKAISGAKQGSYFVDELIGATVLDEEGLRVGAIKDVLRLPANDVWSVEREGKEILLPAVKEIVREVRLKERTVVVRLTEGMLE